MLGLTPADLGDTTPRHGAGCSECGGTGYRGRTAVYEVLSVDAADAADPHQGPVRGCHRRAGPGGGHGRRCVPAAIEKARRGETTFEEAVRVTHSDHAGTQACPALRAHGRAGHGRLPVVLGDPRPRALRELRAPARPGLADLPLVPDPAARAQTPAPGTGRRRAVRSVPADDAASGEGSFWAVATAPSEPAPSEAAPSEPSPSEAAPSEAAPSEAAPSESSPSESSPSESSPSEPST